MNRNLATHPLHPLSFLTLRWKPTCIWIWIFPTTMEMLFDSNKRRKPISNM